MNIVVELGLFACRVAGGEENHVSLVGGGTDELKGFEFEQCGIDGGGHGISSAEMLFAETVTAMGKIFAGSTKIDGFKILNLGRDDDGEVGFLLFVNVAVEVTFVVFVIGVVVVVPEDARILDEDVAFFASNLILDVSDDDLFVTHAVFG